MAATFIESQKSDGIVTLRLASGKVNAINGHAVAGGCMLALACDYRVMVKERAKISLNEIMFGSSVFAGSTEMLRFWVGSANATRVLFSGAMFEAEEALKLGVIGAIGDDAIPVARDLGAKTPPAFASLKSLLRKPIVDEMRRREGESIREFVEIWYSARRGPICGTSRFADGDGIHLELRSTNQRESDRRSRRR